MPYPKTVHEIQKAHTKLEMTILSLVKEFEFETSTSVDQILFWPEKQRVGKDRIQVRVVVEALADEVQIVTAEVPA